MTEEDFKRSSAEITSYSASVRRERRSSQRFLRLSWQTHDRIGARKQQNVCIRLKSPWIFLPWATRLGRVRPLCLSVPFLFRILGHSWFSHGRRLTQPLLSYTHLQVICLDGNPKPADFPRGGGLKRLPAPEVVVLPPSPRRHPTHLLQQHAWWKSIRIFGWFIKI